MDRQTAREVSALIATLIGEIMEDHVDLAVTAGGSMAGDWPGLLVLAGHDIASLAGAIEIIAKRRNNPHPLRRRTQFRPSREHDVAVGRGMSGRAAGRV